MKLGSEKMRRQVNNILSVAHSFFRFICLRIFNPSGVHTGLVERFSPNVVVEVNRGGILKLGSKVREIGRAHV